MFKFEKIKDAFLAASIAIAALATPALAAEGSGGIGGVVKGVGTWADAIKGIIPNLLLAGGFVCIGLGAWQFAKAAKPQSQGGSYVYAFMLLIAGIIMVGARSFVSQTATEMGFQADDISGNWQ